MSAKKLLFPTDFSNHSIDALREAVQLNQALKYEIIIFHAYSRPYSDRKRDYDLKHQLEKLEESIEENFKKVLKKVPEIKEFSYRFKKQLGDSIEMSIQQVKDEEPDLIVMSTKGAVGLWEIWGTKTAKIIKSVEIPVLVFPVNTTLSSLNKIGLACDYSENTEYEKLDFMIELADKKGLKIDIITLNRQEKTMTQEELKYRDHVLNILSHLKPKVSYTEHSHIGKGLIDYSKANEVGLLCILPKSYNFIESLFHESLTTQMAFHCPLPLLVLK